MNIIEDFKNFLANFTGLTSRLEQVSVDLGNALKDASAKDGEIATLKADLAKAPKPEEVTTLQASLDAEKLRADTAATDLANLQAEMPTKINDGITAHLASLGHKPVATVAGNKEPGANTKTKDEFLAMSHTERNEFFRTGGKLAA